MAIPDLKNFLYNEKVYKDKCELQAYSINVLSVTFHVIDTRQLGRKLGTLPVFLLTFYFQNPPMAWGTSESGHMLAAHSMNL